MPRLISRRISSIDGSPSLTSMFLNNWSAKPNFCANRYMMTWSGLDSNSGSTTFSRHCSERLEAVTEPEVSNWVEAGSM
jgi:hypothetical protein